MSEGLDGAVSFGVTRWAQGARPGKGHCSRRRPAGRGSATFVFFAAIVLAGACGGAGGRSERTNGPLVEGDGAWTLVGYTKAVPGEPVFLGYDSFAVQGRKPVRLLSAKVLGVPAGLVVDEVWAIRRSEQRQSVSPGFPPGEATREAISPHRIRGIILDPTPHDYGGGFVQPRYWDWIFAIESHITRPGDYYTKGLRVAYEVEGREYYTDFRIRLNLASEADGDAGEVGEP